MIDRRIFFNINWWLFFFTLLLAGVGILNLYSASAQRLETGIVLTPFYTKQIFWTGFGLIGMLICILFDYRHLSSMAWSIYIFSLLLLLLVPFFGINIYGSKRWLDLYFFHIQPSELVKIAVMILTARLLTKNQVALDWKAFLCILPVGLVPAFVVIKQPDLGSGLTILLIFGGMLLFFGFEKKVLKVLTVFLPLLLFASWFFLHDYQKRRILTFLDPNKDPQGSGYHALQSQIAIGSGKFWGQGFLNGSQTHLQFLPEKHTDFAFTVFGEEWGFVGSMLLLTLFCSFLYQLTVIIQESKDNFGILLGCGIFCYFFIQIFINLSMVLGLLPVVGIPLPFISYGGSATLVNFCLVGLILNVCMRRFMFKKN